MLGLLCSKYWCVVECDWNRRVNANRSARINKELWFSKAVKGLSFTLKSGDFVGFIGGNGAGKVYHHQDAYRAVDSHLLEAFGLGEKIVSSILSWRESRSDMFQSFQSCILI